MDRSQLHRALGVLALSSAFALIVVAQLPFCPMAAVLGIPCPGCGLTRATLALLHGDVRGALALHPLVFVLAPLFGVAIASATLSYVRGPSSARQPTLWLASRGTSWVAATLLVATLGVWGVRFLGYLGGPVHVETWSVWSRAHRPHPALRAH